MGRPKIFRIVRNLPEKNLFIPQNESIQHPPIPVENLTIVEFEALRLKHYEGLNQVSCARKMSISQSTFSRILEAAHKKITLALVEGRGIHVIGGNYNMRELFLGYGCSDCLYEWKTDLEGTYNEEDLNDETLKELLPLSPDIICPKCESKNVFRLKREIFKSSMGNRKM